MTDRKKRQAEGLSEAQAIERAKQGDAEAFEFLYSLHKRRVYSLCLRMTANTAEAEDLTQEAFLQLFRKIGTFRGESAFSTWLHRMAVNVVLMHLRKKGLPVVSLEETTEGEEETPKKDLGPTIRSWPGRSTGCGCRTQWTGYRRDIGRFLCCTMWKDTSTMKLPRWWVVRSETASRSCTKHG